MHSGDTVHKAVVAGQGPAVRLGRKGKIWRGIKTIEAEVLLGGTKYCHQLCHHNYLITYSLHTVYPKTPRYGLTSN